MSAHTPGPWSFLEGEDGDTPTSGPLTITGGNLDDLANVYSRDDATVSVPFEQAIANAALIASAPELLDALKGVVAVADRDTPEFRAARAAIAKAERSPLPGDAS